MIRQVRLEHPGVRHVFALDELTHVANPFSGLQPRGNVHLGHSRTEVVNRECDGEVGSPRLTPSRTWSSYVGSAPFIRNWCAMCNSHVVPLFAGGDTMTSVSRGVYHSRTVGGISGLGGASPPCWAWSINRRAPYGMTRTRLPTLRDVDGGVRGNVLTARACGKGSSHQPRTWQRSRSACHTAQRQPR